MCLVLCGKVHKPAWARPHSSNAPVTAATSGCASPRSHRSGRIDSGPKNPRLPQRVAKFEPANRPSASSIAKDRMCGAPVATVDIIEIGPERVEIGRSEERAEGGAHDALCLAQIGFGERSDGGHRLLPIRCGCYRPDRRRRNRRSFAAP
jgi:hypothetical protein